MALSLTSCPSFLDIRLKKKNATITLLPFTARFQVPTARSSKRIIGLKIQFFDIVILIK